MSTGPRAVGWPGPVGRVPDFPRPGTGVCPGRGLWGPLPRQPVPARRAGPGPTGDAGRPRSSARDRARAEDRWERAAPAGSGTDGKARPDQRAPARAPGTGSRQRTAAAPTGRAVGRPGPDQRVGWPRPGSAYKHPPWGDRMAGSSRPDGRAPGGPRPRTPAALGLSDRRPVPGPRADGRRLGPTPDAGRPSPSAAARARAPPHAGTAWTSRRVHRPPHRQQAPAYPKAAEPPASARSASPRYAAPCGRTASAGSPGLSVPSRRPASARAVARPERPEVDILR